MADEMEVGPVDYLVVEFPGNKMTGEGLPILVVVQRAGYFDQSHLSRSLTRLIGQTPAQIARGERQLSFLYKTSAD